MFLEEEIECGFGVPKLLLLSLLQNVHDSVDIALRQKTNDY